MAKPKTTKTTQKIVKEKKYKNLFQKTPKNFKIGGTVQPKRDLTRFVRWPHYINMQRKKRILYKRLKVPAVINQFTNTITPDRSKVLFKLVEKYKPETKKEKKSRLLQTATEEVKKVKKDDSKKPKFVKSGLNHVTTLVEQSKAKLVIIASDVDPIELVLWLPHLCRKQNVPYCFVKSKSKLGQFVNKKTTSCLAITDVKKEDQAELERLCNGFRESYNKNREHITKDSEVELGFKAQKRLEKIQKLKENDLMQKS